MDQLVPTGDGDGTDVRQPGGVEDDELDGQSHREGEGPGASAGGGAHVTGQDVTSAAGGVKDSCA
nr:hypothetical protein DA06_20075 [Georgenia sp. SUBG003]